MIIAAKDSKVIDKVYQKLAQFFEVKDLRETHSFLGHSIIRDRAQRTVTISQTPFIKKVLEKKGWKDVSPVSTPIQDGITYPIETEVTEEVRTAYQEDLGSAQ